MLSPSYLSTVSSDVVSIFGQAEEEIRDDIARRIVKNGYVTETAKWQIEKAKQIGMLQGDVNKTLAQSTGKSKKEIKRLMSEAGAKSLAFDDVIYKAAGFDPVDVAKSPVLQTMLLQGTDKTLALVGNFTKTTAKASTSAFNNLLDKAYIQILSGAYSPNTAIRNVIKQLASEGIEKIAFPKGYSSLDVAVRRAITTGINQSISKLQIARANELECYLVEVTAHAGARPSHAVWQGGVYSLQGRYRGYADFYDATGYGTGEGLCGWNCYHNFFPFFEGLSTKSFSRDPSADFGRDNDEDFELQQKQRYYERQVRSAKNECIVYNSAMEATDDEELKNMLYEDFQKSSVKLKRREALLKDFVNSSGITRQNDREWVAGFNHSVSSKAVWANKKAH